MQIHFIAIGGSVMHDLAINLSKIGHQVTGSDDQIVEPSRSKLLELGLLPEQLGWDTARITDKLDAVIVGKHASADNPELLTAQRLNLKVYSYPEFIYENSVNKLRVVIAGTYGKTTIMSMIMHVMRKLGKEFDYLIGAQLDGFDSLVKLSSTAPVIFIEGDEYFASSIDTHAKFHYYQPNIALLGNIHFDNHKGFNTEQEYLEQFNRFLDTIVPNGTLVYNKSDQTVLRLVTELKGRKINKHGYQLPEFTINKGVTYINVGDVDIPIKLIGKQNLINVSGAQTVVEWLGIKREDFYTAIQDFKNSIRHLEFVSSNGSSVVYQDYVKSPEKLKSSIKTIKDQFPGVKLLTIIELNPYDDLNETNIYLYKDALLSSDKSLVLVNKVNERGGHVVLHNICDNIRDSFNNENTCALFDVNELVEYVRKFDNEGFNLLFVSFNKNNGVNMLSFADMFFFKQKLF